MTHVVKRGQKTNAKLSIKELRAERDAILAELGLGQRAYALAA